MLRKEYFNGEIVVASENGKVGCVFPMAIFSTLPHAEFEPDGHWIDTPHFSDPIRSGIFPFKKYLKFDKNVIVSKIWQSQPITLLDFVKLSKHFFEEIFIKFHL